jgi:AcrR family transcriptional regulator
LTIVAAFAALPLRAAESRDRSVTLRAFINPGSRRVEITNPTAKPITFKLGFNEQLFEDKDALLKAIRSRRTSACRRLSDPLELPCEAFEQVASTMFHFPELTDQWGTSGWAPARWWAESPMLSFNSFGFGTCGVLSDVLAKVWQELGYETRRRELNGHTVTEVKAGGRWALFDPDIGGFFADGRLVSGIDDLYEDARRLRLANVRRVSSVRRTLDFPHAGFDFYPRLLEASKESGQITDVPTGRDDWRDLTVTIPPGGRLVFPEESGRDCLFPAHADYSGRRDMTNPAHRYAVLEVPAGSVTDIVNGLYPAQIVGDYCADVQYPGASAVTDHFDQVQRFRHARRFGREFAPLEAHSNVLIYYMLNSSVAMERSNQVRLHGESVDRLGVALISAEESYVPPDSSAPCGLFSGDEIVPAESVFATSHTTGYPADFLIDGKLMTGWSSEAVDNGDPQQITFDLGEAQWFGGIRWAPHADYGMLSPSAIVVETSQNGEEFDVVARVDDYRPSQVEWMTKRFKEKYAHYVRLTLCPLQHYSLEGKFQATLAEVEVLR